MAKASAKLVNGNFNFLSISFVRKRSHIADTAVMIGFESDFA